MILQLVDRNEEMVFAWNKYFSNSKDVKVYCADFLSIPADVYACPGNSFGIMDGGLDKKITKKFGNQVPDGFRKLIYQSDLKEILVGQSISLNINVAKLTDPIKAKGFILAPTMRVPMIL